MSNRFQFNRNRPPAGGAGLGVPGLTPMVQKLLIATGAVFLLQFLWPPLDFYLAVTPQLVWKNLYIWQPFTYMWLHGGFLHLFLNLFILWMVGGTMEMSWGSRRFLRFYLQCGIGAGFIILIWQSLTPTGMEVMTLGASGAIFGLLTAFALTWPDRRIVLLPFPFPIRAIWLIPLLFFMQLLLGGGNISHIGHLGGVIIAGFLMRSELRAVIGFRSLRFRWHRFRMRGRLRSIRRDEFERRRRPDDDDQPPTIH